MKKINSWAMLLVFSINCCWGQAILSTQKQEKRLKSYENLEITPQQVIYEQRIYRNPLNGFLELRYVLEDTTTRSYIPLLFGVPLAAYKQVNNIIIATPLSEENQKEIGVKGFFPFKNYKFDCWIQPQFSAIFGNFSQPIQSRTNVLLNTQFYIARGLTLFTGITFPILNYLDPTDLKVRLAPTFLNKFSVFNQTNFLSISAGLFYTDEYGINIQYRHFDINEPWSYGVETGLTGYYNFPPDAFYYRNLNQFLLLADISYRFVRHDLTLKLSGGQYLYQDRGMRIDFIRQFNNVEVGMYGTKTTNGSTVGINFAIPVFPGVIAQSKRLRLRSTDEFRWEYNYSRGYKIGERYRVGYQLDEKLRQYTQSYWQNMYQHYISNFTQ